MQFFRAGFKNNLEIFLCEGLNIRPFLKNSNKNDPGAGEIWLLNNMYIVGKRSFYVCFFRVILFFVPDNYKSIVLLVLRIDRMKRRKRGEFRRFFRSFLFIFIENSAFCIGERYSETILIA